MLKGEGIMIRKSILSVLMGVAFAALLSFAVSAKAGCAGYYYAGCTISCWLDTCQVTCFYIKGPASLEDPTIAD
jgi:hypothetical protein